MGQMTELEFERMEEPRMGIAPSNAPSSRVEKGKKSWKKIALLVGAAVLAIGLVVFAISWSKRGVVSVQTAKVGKQDIASIVTASGEIKPPPEDLANVTANSFGEIVELRVKEGDQVKKGQLLMRTEDVQQGADVDAMQAGLNTEKADVQQGASAVESAAAAMKTAQADYEQAQAKLKQTKDDYARGEQLFKDSLIAQQVYDQRRSDYEVAQAQAQSAQSRVNQSKSQYQSAIFSRDMATARMAQSRAQLVRATDVRSKTIYTSPIDGIITSLPVHLGENVVTGIQNAAGSVLFQVSDLSVITAEVQVDETDIVNVKLGQPAEVNIDAIPNKTFTGKVTQIGQSAVSRTTGQTATNSSTSAQEAKDFKVVVTLNNPPPGLRPGLSTTAKITTATRTNAVTVPIQALTIRTRRELDDAEKNTQGKALAADKPPATVATSSKEKDKEKEEIQGLFVVENGIANFKTVETGIMGSTDVEVVKGIQPGDEIVTGSYQGLRTLKPKTKVKIEKTPPPGANAGAPPSS
jgi:HlyD family secretion protein